MPPVRYKYCIVPKCCNSTSTTPNKIFVDVPRNEETRKLWCHAMKRDLKKNPVLSSKSVRHVCEDHFDLENDFENYMQHKLQGGRLFMKKGVVPHLYTCQKPSKSFQSTARAEKRNHQQTVNNLLIENDGSSSSSSMDVQMDVTMDADSALVTLNKCIQTQLKPLVRSKAVGTSVLTKDTGCDPFPIPGCSKDVALKMPQSISGESEELSSSERGESDYVCSSEDSDYMESDCETKKVQIRECIVPAIERESSMCLGIPTDVKFLIPFLAAKSGCSEVNIMITLKKIRMNLSYAYLGMLFGKSGSQIGKIFKATLFRLAAILQNFIFWPKNSGDIQKNLPIAFRARHRHVQSIIDCFEVSIEKPSNPINQSLTWSEYKKANTIKFLVSCTPDGTLSYISKGYGGRATDSAIMEDCGYLNNLIPNMEVMADRGFKNVAHLIEQKQCKLVRPPSVSANQPMSHEECVSAKQIAALRIHVERVIGRLREFQLLQPHVCMDNHLVQLSDHILLVVCGLVNVQSILIRC